MHENQPGVRINDAWGVAYNAVGELTGLSLLLRRAIWKHVYLQHRSDWYFHDEGTGLLRDARLQLPSGE